MMLRGRIARTPGVDIARDRIAFEREARLDIILSGHPTTHVGVEIQEFLLGDLAPSQWQQAILDTHVVISVATQVGTGDGAENGLQIVEEAEGRVLQHSRIKDRSEEHTSELQ